MSFIGSFAFGKVSDQGIVGCPRIRRLGRRWRLGLQSSGSEIGNGASSRRPRGWSQVGPLVSSSLAVVQDNDRVRSTDNPCPRCGELLLVEKGIPTADPSEPADWATQGLRWCWNGCSFTADKIH
jgi:hypothetical protein